VKALREAGVDSIAVCFLWSFRNSSHEDAALELVKELAPDIYATSSHQVIPLEGEYERFITTVLDAYVGPATQSYMASVASFLAERKLEPRLLLMKADGTTAYADSVMPVATVHSGPAAGVKAAEMLGKILGYENVIATDVGGTTFDVSVITDGRPSYNREPQIEKYRTLYPTLDIVSLGAGGGTIVRADKELGSIHVGPDSAGSNPGPACYGFGGNEATISDAALLLGYLDPDFFNGGRMGLHRAEAERVFTPIADALGMGLTEAAWGAYEILNAHMSDLIMGMTVRRGLNVRDYVLFSFGGAGPAHVAYMGATLGARKAIIPISSSVYSALGLATTPIGHTFVKYDYRVLPISAEVLNENIGPLHRRVREELLAGGAREDSLDISAFIDMQYRLQINAVTMKLPTKDEYGEEDAEALGPLFDQAYTDLYGEGSAYPEAGRAAVSYLVRGEGIIHDFSPSPQPFGEGDAGQARRPDREAYFKGTGFVNTAIYDFSKLAPGNEVVGPSVIEAEETTIVVPPGFHAKLDSYRNVEIATEEGSRET
jgi:N-methylhydantoinase A